MVIMIIAISAICLLIYLQVSSQVGKFQVGQLIIMIVVSNFLAVLTLFGFTSFSKDKLQNDPGILFWMACCLRVGSNNSSKDKQARRNTTKSFRNSYSKNTQDSESNQGLIQKLSRGHRKRKVLAMSNASSASVSSIDFLSPADFNV